MIYLMEIPFQRNIGSTTSSLILRCVMAATLIDGIKERQSGLMNQVKILDLL